MRIIAQHQVAPEMESHIDQEVLHKQVLHNLGAAITEHVIKLADWKTETNGPHYPTIHKMGGHFFGEVEFRKIRNDIRDTIHDNKISIKDKWKHIEGLLGDTSCNEYQNSAVKREQRINELKRVNCELNRLNKKRADMNNTQAESIRELQGELSNTKKEFDETLCRLAHTEFQLKEAQGKISLQDNCIATMQVDLKYKQDLKIQSEMLSAAIQLQGPELAVHEGQKAYIKQLEQELNAAKIERAHFLKLYQDEKDKVLQLTDESPNLKNGTIEEHLRSEKVRLKQELETLQKEHISVVQSDSQRGLEVLELRKKVQELEANTAAYMLNNAAKEESKLEKRVSTIEAFLMKNNFWSWTRFIAKYGR